MKEKMDGSSVFETQLDEICLFPLQNKKKSFTFDDKKADEVKNISTKVRSAGEAAGTRQLGT